MFIHSTGGSSTRLKSGNSYEFNVIAKFSEAKNWLQNFTIDEGLGKFNTAKEYFVLHPRKRKNKLTFYNAEDFKPEFELSLTPKQNLGQLKNSVSIDLIESKLFIYNHQFLNYCSLIK